MTKTATLRLVARRNAPFVWRRQVMDGLTPVDITGYAFALQLRLYGGAAGSALISLGTTTTVGGEGIRIVDAAAGLFEIVILEASLNILPGIHQPEAGDPQTFAYDLRVTPSGGVAEIWLEGDFILHPGTTKAS
ncbi:MAG: hypothetical protein CL949_19565 [Erythrobacter sp.]|nr:hypothetical protein [Erythrobacter sp.]|tara:strand:+ start:1853 stop:2254 length:402 start_codon:yes stop_codon:yes gene_type:complete